MVFFNDISDSKFILASWYILGKRWVPTWVCFQLKNIRR